MRKGKVPVPDLWRTDPDADTRGPKTYRIRDVSIWILSWIQFRGSVPQDNGFAYLSFLLISFCRHIYISLPRKQVTNKSQNCRNQGFLLGGRIRKAHKLTDPTDPENWFKVVLNLFKNTFLTLLLALEFVRSYVLQNLFYTRTYRASEVAWNVVEAQTTTVQSSQ